MPGVSTDSRKQGESLENQISSYERSLKANPEYELDVYKRQGIGKPQWIEESINTLFFGQTESEIIRSAGVQCLINKMCIRDRPYPFSGWTSARGVEIRRISGISVIGRRVI